MDLKQLRDGIDEIDSSILGNLEVEKREKWTKPRISRNFFVKFQFST